MSFSKFLFLVFLGHSSLFASYFVPEEDELYHIKSLSSGGYLASRDYKDKKDGAYLVSEPNDYTPWRLEGSKKENSIHILRHCYQR